jgi:hypothetical protein
MSKDKYNYNHLQSSIKNACCISPETDYIVSSWFKSSGKDIWLRRLDSKIYSCNVLTLFAAIYKIKDKYHGIVFGLESPIICCTLEAAMIHLDTLALSSGYRLPEPFGVGSDV